MNTLYRFVVKPLLFKFDPEFVHVQMTNFGEILGNFEAGKATTKLLFGFQSPILEQNIAGIDFSNPIGLAAGFDYEAKLTQILPSLGFGFGTVGTITNLPYIGNPRPMLGRLPKSKSLMVNKGFKNNGIEWTSFKLKKLAFQIPIGISIGRTNSPTLKTQQQSIADIIAAFKTAESYNLKTKHYELNISCPNLFGNISFYPPKNLEALLKAVDSLKLQKPLFIKMPIEKSDQEVRKMLDVIVKHKIKGVIFGNLQKDRKDPALHADEVARFPKGNFSGLPTQKRSDELIKLSYKNYGKELIIIGCGGVFNAGDAYHKIKLGASLVQMITGMIYEGPGVIGNINRGLVDLLKKDGYRSITDAIGAENR